MLKVSGEITLEFRALILNVFCFLLLLATYSAFVRPESGPFEVLSFAKCANRGPCFWFVCALSLSLSLSLSWSMVLSSHSKLVPSTSCWFCLMCKNRGLPRDKDLDSCAGTEERKRVFAGTRWLMAARELHALWVWLTAAPGRTGQFHLLLRSNVLWGAKEWAAAVGANIIMRSVTDRLPHN